MELTKTISDRHSIRAYSSQPVARDTISGIMELVRLAPSAVNFQPWHFIILTENDEREALWPVYHREWFRSAPVVIVACVNRELSWKRNRDGKDFGDVDVAIAVDHLTLAATDQGLATCWIGNFDPGLASTILGLPGHLYPLVLVTLGYSAGEAPAKKRKASGEIISWGKYGNE